jgi:hypothetical protein
MNEPQAWRQRLHGGAVVIVTFALRGLNTNIDWLLPFFALVPAWGAFMRLHRRAYLVISAEGILVSRLG